MATSGTPIQKPQQNSHGNKTSGRKTILQLLFLAFLVIGTIWIIRTQNDTPFQKDSGEIFGTFYHITYQSNEDLRPEIEAELNNCIHF